MKLSLKARRVAALAHKTFDVSKPQVSSLSRQQAMRRLTRQRQIITLLIVVLACESMFIFLDQKNSNGRKVLNPTTVFVVKDLVGRHMVLPEDEEPALATVTDKTKISTDFFKQAENGDKLLIYQDHKTAIIYRPSLDKIIAVGPVSIDTPPTPKSEN